MSIDKKRIRIWGECLQKIETLLKEIMVLHDNKKLLTATFLTLPLFELVLYLRLATAYPEQDLERKNLSNLIDIAIYSLKEEKIKDDLIQARSFRNKMTHNKEFSLTSKDELSLGFQNMMSVIGVLIANSKKETEVLLAKHRPD